MAGNIYALLMTVGFTVLTAIEGGLAGHSIARLACVPICACLFAGPDSGRVWCVVCLGAVVAFGVSSSLGYHSPVLYPAQWTALVSAAGYLALTLFMSTLGILFETSRQRAFQELHLSLEELSHSEARFRAIFENNALGVALLDSQGKVQMGNGHLAAVLGGLPANLVINLVAMIHPEQRVDFLEAIRREQSLAAVPARPPGSLGVDKEFILELPGLGPRTFRFSFRGMPGGEGICAVLDDVTLQRAAQRDAAQREKSASIDTLLGGSAHELHNKLTPMAGFAEMILQQAKRGRPLEDLADYCRIIHQGAMDSGKIVAQSVDLTHPPTLVQQECDFRKWVEGACEVLTPRLLKAGIRLRLELSSDEVIVNIDVSRIKQVFSNLVCNAIEAMTEVPERHLGIGVEAEGDAALLTVSDNGPGIHAEHRTRLFDPFSLPREKAKPV